MPSSTLFLLLLAVNLSVQFPPVPPGVTDWETGMPVTEEEDLDKLRAYTNQQGQINIIGWAQNKKPMSFPLFFKEKSAGGPKNPLYFDMKICPEPLMECNNGFVLCFVGQLDPDNNGVSRTFELKNDDDNPIGKRCNEPGIWNNWKGMEAGKKMHGLQIQLNKTDGSYQVYASYCKVEKENSNGDMRVKRDIIPPKGRGDDGGCLILRFNTDSSIGGSWVAGGKVEDRSKDFRQRVHNGAMLDQQDPVFSLPLDVLSKFNPANDLFGVIGSQDCGIRITFEGDSLKRCIKPEDCPHKTTPPKTKCEVHYQLAKAAKIEELPEEVKKPKDDGKDEEVVKGKRSKRGLLEKDGSEARYVRVGLLRKRMEDSKHKQDFTKLLDTVKKSSKPSKLLGYIENLLAPDSRIRTLRARAVFDYWKLDESINEPVVKRINCSNAIDLIYDVVDKSQQQPGKEDVQNFNGDFDRFKGCCFSLVLTQQTPPSPLAKFKEGKDWPSNFAPQDITVGLNHTLSQDQMIAALFKYSLSPYAIYDFAFGRGNYLSSGAAEPKEFTNGHLFGPPELAVREQQEAYKVKVDFRPKPKPEELANWGIDTDKVRLELAQPVVQCGCKGKSESPKGDEGAEHLQMRLPILVVYPAKETAPNTYVRIGQKTLEGHFTVLPDGRKVPVTEGDRKAYDEGWWNKLLMAKAQKQMEMNMDQLNKKGAPVDEDEENDVQVEDDIDRQPDNEEEEEEDDEEEEY